MKEPLPFYQPIANRMGSALLCFVALMLFLNNQSQRVAQGQTGTVTVSVRVNRAVDDVEERITDGVMYTDSSDLEVGDDPETLGDQAVGLRFRALTIPQGATILNAYIEFETDEISQEPTAVMFYGHNVHNAPVFTTALRNLTSRPKTTAAVAWSNIPAWNAIGQKQQTPNLAPIVQEIVNRSSWVAGNNLVFIMDGTGRRTAKAFESAAATAPLLVIQYGTTSATATASATATPTTAPRSDTIADNFDNANGASTGFTGSDGSLPWAGNWSNPGQNFIQTFANWCKSGYCLRMYGNSVNAISTRRANLSGASSATLTFDYARHEGSAGNASVQFSSDGATYQTIDNLPTQYPATARTYTIPAAYLTANFALRFVATNSSGLTDLYIDNVVITLLGGTPAPTVTPTTIAPPTPPPAPPAPTPPTAPTATTTPTTPTATTPTVTPTATPQGTPPVLQSISVRINQSLNDVEESIANGAVSATSNDLELINDPGTSAGDQKIGLRFTNVVIPRGAYISAASIEFEVDETNSGATALTIRAQESDNAPAFTTAAFNVSNRTLTSAAVNWTPPVWEALNVKQVTPDLTALVQAIVNRSGWNSGNSLLFVINGSGQRTAKAYDLAPATAPLLRIDYSTAPIVVNDLIAENLEVTQAIQDLNHSVRLVKDKRTFVRFYARTDQGKAQVSAQLQAQQGGQSVTLTPINGDAANAVSLSSSTTRATLAGSYLFELPAGFREGNVTLTARVNPQGIVAENNPNNNSSSVTVSFEPVQAVRLMLYSIGYGANYYPSEFDLSMLESWLRRAYPISTLQVTRRRLYYGNSLPSCEAVRNLLASERTRDLSAGAPSEARYYGMVTDLGSFMRGCGWQYTSTGPTGVGNYSWDTDGTYGDWYGGHELGHGFLREHANFCGATGGAPYPYPNGQISPALSGPTAIYGFDAGTQAIYGPDWKDIMTYCEREWISDFTYEALMTTIQNLPVGAAGVDQPYLRNRMDRLLISGLVTPTTNLATLSPIFTLPNAGEVVESTPGDYAIVLKDGAGTAVARYPFTPHPFDYGPPAPTTEGQVATAELIEALGIHELVPTVEGVTTVELWGPGNLLLHSVVAQPGKPVVTLHTPQPGQIIVSDTLTVAWDAVDPDGEALFYNVEYSVDQGQSWESVALNLTQPQLTVALGDLRRGADLRFRVWASDGIHTTIATMSDGLALPNSVVTVKISTPLTATTVTYGQPILFQGSGYDVDSGYLPTEALVWVSDRDGQVGSGATFSNTTLSVGTHLIELRGINHQGNSASDAIQIQVVEATPEQQPLRFFLPLVNN